MFNRFLVKLHRPVNLNAATNGIKCTGNKTPHNPSVKWPVMCGVLYINNTLGPKMFGVSGLFMK